MLHILAYLCKIRKEHTPSLHIIDYGSFSKVFRPFT